MNSLNIYIGQIVELEIASKKTIVGKLVEVGSDIVVLFNGRHFLYVPVAHLLSVRRGETSDTSAEYLTNQSTPLEKDSKLLTLKQIVTNASGIFVELFLAGNHTIYGYIKHIKEDYIVFDSPAFNTMYIPIAHIKWLIPYLNQTPYQMKTDQQLISSDESVAPTFDEQVKKFIGKIVLFELGKDPQKIGLLKNVENSLLELLSGNGDVIYLNITHLKSMHVGI